MSGLLSHRWVLWRMCGHPGRLGHDICKCAHTGVALLDTLDMTCADVDTHNDVVIGMAVQDAHM